MLVVLEGVLVVVHGQEFCLLARLHSLNGRQRGHLSGPSRVSWAWVTIGVAAVVHAAFMWSRVLLLMALARGRRGWAWAPFHLAVKTTAAAVRSQIVESVRVTLSSSRPRKSFEFRVHHSRLTNIVGMLKSHIFFGKDGVNIVTLYQRKGLSWLSNWPEQENNSRTFFRERAWSRAQQFANNYVQCSRAAEFFWGDFGVKLHHWVWLKTWLHTNFWVPTLSFYHNTRASK